MFIAEEKTYTWNATFTAIDPYTVNLSIEAPDNFSQEFSTFVLWIKKGDIENDLPYFEVNEISTDERSFLVRGLKPNSKYSFILDAFRRGDMKRFPIERSVSTPPEGNEVARLHPLRLVKSPHAVL